MWYTGYFGQSITISTTVKDTLVAFRFCSKICCILLVYLLCHIATAEPIMPTVINVIKSKSKDSNSVTFQYMN